MEGAVCEEGTDKFHAVTAGRGANQLVRQSENGVGAAYYYVGLAVWIGHDYLCRRSEGGSRDVL